MAIGVVFGRGHVSKTALLKNDARSVTVLSRLRRWQRCQRRCFWWRGFWRVSWASVMGYGAQKSLCSSLSPPGGAWCVACSEVVSGDMLCRGGASSSDDL